MVDRGALLASRWTGHVLVRRCALKTWNAFRAAALLREGSISVKFFGATLCTDTIAFSSEAENGSAKKTREARKLERFLF
jgi:hypothetical protein